MEVVSPLKSLLAVSLTGASGVGGTLIYQTAVPGSWKDVLIKEGYYILDKDDYYKAAYEDNKGDIGKIDHFKNGDSLTKDTAHTKIKQWCETELPKPYSADLKIRKNIVSLCTFDGVITVKGKLIAAGQSSFIIDETDGDKYYKTVFAIYRYLERFRNFFEKWNHNDSITKETGVSEGYTKLKNICESALKKPYKTIDDFKYYKNVSWWCSKLEYENFEGLAKKRQENWQTDEEGTGKGNIWKDTEAVTKYMLTTSEGEDQTQQTLDDAKVKEWCTQNKTTPLHENNNYQEKFVVFLSVCQGTTDSSD